jgi:uncharacterized RDD family membrane protein YckC
MTENILPIVYPRLIRRVQAYLIDIFIIVFLAVGLFLLVTAIAVEPPWLRIAIVFVPFFIFEPVLVSFTGGTVGHHLLKLKVQNASNIKNINIVLAFFRYILKSLLGTISLLFVLTTRKHQAIHDFLTNSIVVYKDATQVPEHEALAERKIEEEGFIYPSKLRRVVMIILYNILLFILMAYLSGVFLSVACLDNNKCTTAENIISYVMGFIWLISLGLILVGGWKARIFGCKRKRIEKIADLHSKETELDGM